jgi:hypothetical protein
MSIKLLSRSGANNRLPLNQPIFYICAVYGGLAVALVIAYLQAQVPIDDLMRDPLATVNLPPYIGLFSNLGILLWCAATTLCLFTSLVLWRANQQRSLSNFLLYSGLLSLLLTLDDLYLLHEFVFPKVLNVPEKAVLLIYGIAFCTYLIKFRRTIFSTRYWGFLGLAMVLFFASLSLDTLLPQVISGPTEVLIEDGFKVFGIVSWLGYFLMVCSCATDQIIPTSRS